MKKELSEEKPSIWIGKSGVTREVIQKISNQLDRDQVVKIKIHKTALKEHNIKKLAREVAIKAEATLIDIRGRCFSLYQIKKPRPRIAS